MTTVKLSTLLTASVGLLVLANPTVEAQTRSGVDERGTSIIVEIQESSLEVRSVITDQLIPNIRELGAGLKRDHERAVAQQQQWMTSGDIDDAMACEETVAGALSNAVNNLQDICELEGPVREACAELNKNLRDGLEEYQGRKDHHRLKAETYQAEAAHVTESMDSLAERFGEYVAAGQELPLEIDTLVRQLDHSLRLLQNRQKLSEDAERALDQWLDRCNSFQGVLDRLGADYALVFRAARDHVALLGDVAEQRNDVLNMRSLAHGLESISGDLLTAQTGFDAITEGLHDLFLTPSDPFGGERVSDVLNVDSDRGLQILSRWSQERSL